MEKTPFFSVTNKENAKTNNSQRITVFREMNVPAF